MKQKLYTLLFLGIHIGYMLAIALPFLTHEKDASCIVLEQEETEAQGDFEYLGLMGYLMYSQEFESASRSIDNRSFTEFSIAISDLKHSKPETPPPNC